MKRTISAEVGKGSANHNSRKFRAENVDGSRTDRNIDYCNERIQTVYHQLFDEALKRYNEKQTRSDRRIPNYYEKIRSGNQEKPFHEIILQIGNKEDMSATGEYAELAQTVLDEYYQSFQERNPNLRVFSAHLHMDEATPHIHIDFVPFTTGSKRGLDTRVSLKQALAAQGFKGGTRGATEWAQWVQSEKEQLAAVMERYDIQWKQKGTHEKHLSVLDYKKQREKEIAALDTTLAEKQDELETVQSRIDNFDQGAQSIEKLEQRIESDAEFQLPDPPTLMTAKTYKQRFVDPLIKNAICHNIFDNQLMNSRNDYRHFIIIRVARFIHRQRYVKCICILCIKIMAVIELPIMGRFVNCCCNKYRCVFRQILRMYDCDMIITAINIISIFRRAEHIDCGCILLEHLDLVADICRNAF